MLVSLLHAGLVLSRVYGSENGVWPEVSDVLAPVRMPLFFFISGVLASRAVRRPLRSTRRRTLGMYYLYVVWTLLTLVLTGWWSERSPLELDLVGRALILPTGIWFLFALALYFLVAAVAGRLLGSRAGWLLVPASALAVAAPAIDAAGFGDLPQPFGHVFLGSLAAYLVWFLAGVHGRRALEWVRAQASWPLVLGGASLFGAATWFALVHGVQAPAALPLSALALPTALALFAKVPLRNPLGGLLVVVGRRTLPIYVMQLILLRVLLLVSAPDTGVLWTGVGEATANIVVPVVAVLMVAIGWWIGWVIERVPILRPLLTAPSWLVGRDRRVDSNHEDADASPDLARGIEHHPRPHADRPPQR